MAIFHSFHSLIFKHSTTVWPDLAKIRHFGKTLNISGYSLRVYFVLGKILTLIRQIFNNIGEFFNGC